MSFSKKAKFEVLKNNITDNQCYLAFLCGLILSCGQYKINEDQTLDLHLVTDLGEVYEKINLLLNKIYGDYATLEIADDYKINKTTYYKISFSQEISYKILLDTKILFLDNTVIKENKFENIEILKNEECKKSFVSAAFLGCGTSSIKIDISDRKSTGYHIEFTSHNESFLNGLASILSEYEISPKLIKRKNIYVLYVKEKDEVSNILALMGANNAVLNLQNEIVTRDLRNKINRQNNCFSANIGKTVEASAKQLEAILYIERVMELSDLSEDLQKVALLRLANSEESLDELLKLSSLPLTKSGLNYRFNKLIRIAQKLKDGKY